LNGRVVVRGTGGYSSTWTSLSVGSDGGGDSSVGSGGDSSGTKSSNRSGKGKARASSESVASMPADRSYPQCLFHVTNESADDGGTTLRGRLFVSPFTAYEGAKTRDYAETEIDSERERPISWCVGAEDVLYVW
jgi:hypothetical protein